MAAHQAPPSLEFSRQEYWSGFPFPSPMHACMLGHFSRVQLYATPWTAAHQAPLSTGLSRQEYWSGSPFPSPMYACMHAKLLQLCPTLCDPMDSSPPGSSVHRTLQARTLEWVAIACSAWLMGRLLPCFKDVRIVKVWQWGVNICRCRMIFVYTCHSLHRSFWNNIYFITVTVSFKNKYKSLKGKEIYIVCYQKLHSKKTLFF